MDDDDDIMRYELPNMIQVKTHIIIILIGKKYIVRRGIIYLIFNFYNLL